MYYSRRHSATADSPNTIEYKIGEIFGELKNRVQSGYNLREVINRVDELRFQTSAEKHEMIETIEEGDILKADAEALVNTVNCVGVMGRGIAVQFKKKFPDNFAAYKKACDANELKLGRVFIFDMGKMFNPRYIVNFPTKDHWRSESKIASVEEGLVDLVREVKARNIKSIAIPPLGCGLGGLD